MTFKPSTTQAILESVEQTIVGRSSKPAEIKYLDGGSSVATVRIAVNNGRDKDAHWFDVEAWGDQAEQLANQISEKGMLLKASGRIKEDSWRKQDGTDVTSLKMTAQHFEVLGKKELPF